VLFKNSIAFNVLNAFLHVSFCYDANNTGSNLETAANLKLLKKWEYFLFLKSYTFLHRLLTRNLLTSDSWSFLPILESQISHGWLNDHFSTWDACKAELWNLCKSGITRKCRNSWSFLPMPVLQISHPHTLTPSR
jgi:hypothetical protein